eukprot:1161710-Pelagomonas_calceolata.AAC.11
MPHLCVARGLHSLLGCSILLVACSFLCNRVKLFRAAFDCSLDGLELLMGEEWDAEFAAAARAGSEGSTRLQ